MSAILRDRQLVDLIDRIERAHGSVNAMLLLDAPARDDLLDLAETVLGALGEAGDYLRQLREGRH
jgi:hypothetical protein